MTGAYRCWAEVDLDAMRENLAWLRHRVGPGVMILTVVKADAYGHGLKPIAALLMQSGTDIFGVANLAEAEAIRSVGQGWPILILGPCLPGEVARAVEDDIMPTISSLEEAKLFSAAATKLGRVARVHVKVDTGMGRLGVAPSQAIELIERVQGLPGLRLEGLCTHFAAAEDDAAFTRQQVRRFRGLLGELEGAGIRVALIHASNSAALLHQPDTRFNIVRPGLLVYGVAPPGRRRLDRLFQRRLRPALSWKCRVGLVKTVPKGTSLSYGRGFITPRAMRVATITAGYGDGYLRAGSNRARVLIHGHFCRILGRITMDQMIVDVSRLERVEAGDEVVLIGQQGRHAISATTLAGWCGTIPWEILTSIAYRVPRVYRGGSAA
jgi:alanine racemase